MQVDRTAGEAALRRGGRRVRAVPDVRAHELVAERARVRGRDAAVSHGGTILSYAELDARAEAAAAQLGRAGAGPEAIVGICLERSIAAVVALLGVAKAGAAFLPLDPAYPRDRLVFMVEDSRAGPVIAPPGQAGDLGATPLVLDDAPQPGRATVRRPHELALAYVIYTSGSTGTPKGVGLHHRGLTNLVLEWGELLRIGPGRRVLQFAPLSFDAAIAEILGTLAWGGELVLMREGEWLEAPSLSAFLRERRIDAVTLPPSLLAEERPEQLPRLDTVVSAGEPCRDGIVAAWAPGRRLLNGYGPTECTVAAAYSPPLAPGERITVGTPIANVSVHVLDEALRLVPPGTTGELYIGGAGVARGYVGRPGLTAARFVPNPFAAQPGERIYRSGDLGRVDATGRIDVAGRVDAQVKIRGHRIELGEIEHVLAGHPQVGTAAAVVGTTRAGDACIFAFVSGIGGAGAEQSLREYCASQLPAFMLPHRIVPLPSLPTLPNGKVDRRALAASAQPGVSPIATSTRRRPE